MISQLRRVPKSTGYGFRFTLFQMQNMAESKGLILEEENPTVNNGYSRYSLTDNSKGVTALCKNLNEVYQELA